jgi:hypothetical protein
MRAYIAAVLLAAGLVVPAVAEAAQPLANVQQPAAEQAAQLKRQKAYRRAVTTRGARASQPRTAAGTAARTAPASGPTRIVPTTVAAPAARPSGWSNSMLSWWRGESTPTGTGQVDSEQVSAEPAAARVETAAVVAEPAKTSRRKGRRTTKSESTATGAVPEAAPAEVKPEKPTRSKRRSARRSKSRAHQVALRSSGQAEKAAGETPPEPRKKPENLAGKASSSKAAKPDASEADAAVGSISPAEPTGGAQQMAAVSHEHDATGGEATWWQRQGNPVVFNFRDCVASYASREAARSKEGTWADLLIRATESDCRAPFDEMARTLAKRFGEARIEPVMRELIDTTFLPAAKQAAAAGTPSSDIPPLPAIPDGTPTQ